MSFLIDIGVGTAPFFNTVFGGLAGLFLSNQAPVATALASIAIAQNQPYSKPNSTQGLPYISQPAAYVDPNKANLTPCDPSPEHKYCGKDAKHVYIDGAELEGADPNTFVILNHCVAKDNNSVFCIGDDFEECCDFGSVAGIDAKTYTLLPGSTWYAKDKNRYYSGASPMDVTDTSTFVVINDCYAKDLKQVYHGSAAIKGADPNTFMTIAGYHCWYSKDANHVYIRGQINQELDVQTFSVISQMCSKDARIVYLDDGGNESKVIRGADPNTFTPLTTASLAGTFGGPKTDHLCVWAKDAKQEFISMVIRCLVQTQTLLSY